MLNSARLKEIMTAQSKAGVGRLELNFETAFEVIEALKQAEQAVQRVREATNQTWGSAISAKRLVRRALDGEQA